MGTNLRQLEKNSRLSAREGLQIIPQICDALQYAHDEGIVHRDNKPENVLIDRKGRVKIADFGLAKILDPDQASARLTVEGQVMGTPHYMAPEQLERPLSVDHRADIHAAIMESAIYDFSPSANITAGGVVLENGAPALIITAMTAPTLS